MQNFVTNVLQITSPIVRCAGVSYIKAGLKVRQNPTAKVPTLVSCPVFSVKMISLASCTIALLLSSAVFAAPAAPAASGVSPAISSIVPAASHSSSAKPSSTTKSSTVSVTSSAPASSATLPFIDLDPNGPLWGPDETNPQPIRGSLGATIMGPDDIDTARNNPDLIAAPSTDHGSVYVINPTFVSLNKLINGINSKNAKWPFSLSHNRLQTGGWARQQNGNAKPLSLLEVTLTLFFFSSQRYASRHW